MSTTSATADGPVLTVTELHAGYGRMEVVHGVSLEVACGELVTVVGRNGAGKTTLLKAIAGQRYSSRQAAGTVTVCGVETSALPAEKVGGHGLALVPEGHRLFAGLTVAENLRLGMFPARKSAARDLQRRLSRVHELFPILAEFAARKAGQLSGGQQQMVAIGQALMADPAVLLLDEPSSGLAPAVTDQIYAAVGELRAAGVGLLVVEQNLDRALAAADRAYVLQRGRVALCGAAAELRSDSRVAAAIHGLDLPASDLPANASTPAKRSLR